MTYQGWIGPHRCSTRRACRPSRNPTCRSPPQCLSRDSRCTAKPGNPASPSTCTAAPSLRRTRQSPACTSPPVHKQLLAVPYLPNTTPPITYCWTGLLILDHSYLAGNLTNAKIAETKALEPLKPWHFCTSNFWTCYCPNEIWVVQD